MDDWTEYQQLQRVVKGKKPAAMGLRWERGKPRAPKKGSLKDCYITLPGDLLTPKGAETLVYTIRQLVPAAGWRACYVDGDGQTFVEAFEYFALCDITVGEGTQPAILALEYTSEGGWELLQSNSNFLRIVPPWEEAS